MWWVVASFLWLIRNLILEFVFFVLVDVVAKAPLREATNDSEKRTIWLYESGVLLALCAVVYWTDHTPYLLLILAITTGVYTQLHGRVDLQRWWSSWMIWWEEYQQHEESMRQMQAQQAKQQANVSLSAAGTALMTPALGAFPPSPSTQGPAGYPHILPTRGYPPNVTLLPGQNVPSAGTSQHSPSLPNSPSGVIHKSVPGAGMLWSSSHPPSSAPAPSSNPGLIHSAMSLFSGQAKLPQGTNQGDGVSGTAASSKWFGGELRRRPLRPTGGSFMLSPSLGLASSGANAIKTKVMNVFGFGDPSCIMPPGLKNKGQNLCFINAVLQCLARSPYLAQCLTVDAAKELECTVSESMLLSRLAELLDLLTAEPDSLDTNILDTADFRQAAAALNSSLVAPVGQPQRQQDSAEFLMWLLDTVHGILNKNRQALSCGADTGAGEDRFTNAQLTELRRIYGDLTPSTAKELKEACLRAIELANGLENDSYAEAIQRLSDLEWLLHKQLNESIVDALFTGQLVEASLCLSNNRISVSLQSFNMLPVPLASPRHVSGLVLLEDCFTSFCHIEHLVGTGATWDAHQAPQQLRGAGTAGSRAATPQMTSKLRGNVRFSEADSALQSPFSHVSSAAVSPILGQHEFINDSGFSDSVFKTSTPIRESNSSKALPYTGDVQRRCLLRQLPECLIIQLKRFLFNTHLGRPTKLRAPVSVRLKGLDLHALVYDNVTQREDLTAPAGGSGMQTYDLYGLCLHLGAESTNHGHYISYCLCADNQWYRFDDETVTKVNMEYELTTSEVRQNAYLLFYKRALS